MSVRGHYRLLLTLGCLLLVVALAGCGVSRANRASLRPVRGQNPTPQGAQPARTSEQAITVDGRERTYQLHLPTANSTEQRRPLVLAFHGAGGQGPSMAGLSRLNELADRYGFIVAYPDGIDRHWNDGRSDGRRAIDGDIDDVAFIRALIAHLATTQSIDRTRVYATGMSNGAIFTQRLACELSDEIAAIGAVAGSLAATLAENCAPGRPVPMLMIMGEADPFVPWAGGRVAGIGAGAVLSVSDTIAHWVRQDGCAATPTITQEPDSVPDDGTTVRRESYNGCRAGAEVTLYAVVNGGHAWPGGPQYLPESTIGKTSRDIDAAAIIWQFFAAHPRP